MFKFRDDVPTDLRETAQQAFKEGIEGLPTTIPFIRSVHVGLISTLPRSGTSALPHLLTT